MNAAAFRRIALAEATQQYLRDWPTSVIEKNGVMKSITIVFPVFNEAETLPELHRCVSEVLQSISHTFELIFVNDGSTDSSLHVLKKLATDDPRVRVICLSRNFGHQPALMAGIDAAQGDAVILMDADLQDSPSAIAAFIREWETGSEVVYAVRTKRKEGPFKRMAFFCFYRLQRLLTRVSMPLDAGVFSLMDRRVVDVLKKMPERNRYLVGLRCYAGFRQKGIPVERGPRYRGSPRVSVSGLVRLAMDGILAFSTIPLRLISVIGLLVSIVSFVVSLVALVAKYGFHQQPFNWPFGLSTIFFFGGIQLVSMGIIGEYVGRIYEEVKQRPYYIVDAEINAGNSVGVSGEKSV
jgi:dolichol-phosphate mannosyltransferase